MLLYIIYVLHDLLGVPKNRVGVKILGWVEPKIKLLLSLPFSLCVHICVHYVRLSRHIP